MPCCTCPALAEADDSPEERILEAFAFVVGATGHNRGDGTGICESRTVVRLM
jgi:hypothetical protein